MNSVSDEVVERWRAEFIDLFVKHSLRPERYKKELEDSFDVGQKRFSSAHVQNTWLWFLMARQSVVIELPEPLEFDDGHDEPSLHYWPTQIKCAIEAQGYTVKREPK